MPEDIVNAVYGPADKPSSHPTIGPIIEGIKHCLNYQDTALVKVKRVFDKISLLLPAMQTVDIQKDVEHQQGIDHFLEKISSRPNRQK